MSNRRMAVMVLALAFILLPIGLSLSFDNGTDGAAELEIDSKSVDVGSFNERSSGRLSVTITNTSTTTEKTVDVFVTRMNDKDGNRLAETTVTVPVRTDGTNGSKTADLHFKIGSPGTHYVTIWVMPDTDFPVVGEGEDVVTLSKQTVKINVDSSIWSNTTTYIIIVIVVIIVIVAVYLRMRSTRAPKTQGTFTAMDAERKASKEKRSPDVVRASEAAPVTEGTFTAMERERKEAKEKRPADIPVAETAEPVVTEKKETKDVSPTEKQEYTGRVSRTKPKQQQSSQRKSNPNSRKSSKRK